MEEKEMTVGELLQSKQFKEKLQKRIDSFEASYKEKEKQLKSGQHFKSTPYIRLRKMGALNANTMANIYAEVIDKTTPLPSALRQQVSMICEPVFKACLVDCAKKFKEEKKDERNDKSK